MSDVYQQLFSPMMVSIKEKLAQALMSKNSRRVFHGRGKCFSGLDWINVDYLDNVLLATVFSIPNEHDENALMSALRHALTISLDEPLFDEPSFDKAGADKTRADKALKDTLNGVFIQRRDQAKAPFECLYGEIPEQAYARRKGILFDVSFTQQNVGYFLDIEPVRQWLEVHASGKKVLNLFSYTCAFSVVAASSGASTVVNMDLSRRSLDRGRKNHQINQLNTENIKFFAHDIFRSWGKLRKLSPYDIVVIDPPSFQKGSFVATKDYAKVLRRMSDLVAPNGCFIACLNAPEIKKEDFVSWVEESAEGFSLEHVLAQHDDFPEREAQRGLKMLVYRKNAE